MPDKPVADNLRDAMDKQGITDPVIRAGIPAIASAEGGLTDLKPELGYAHTANSRIRQVFGQRVAMLDDDALDGLKADQVKFFNWVYGAQFQNIHHLGNTEPNDGFDWRGRGPIQFTGRANYTLYSRRAGCPQVMQNPELVNDPEIGAAMTVAYIVHRYKGGGFDALMACVGNNTPDIAARKRAAFDRFMASSEFAAGQPAPQDPGAPPAMGAAARPVLRRGDKGTAVETLQQALIDVGFSCGNAGADGNFGGDTENAIAAFQTTRGLSVTRIADDATWAALRPSV